MFKLSRIHRRKIMLLVLAILLIPPGIIALLLMPLVVVFGDLRWGWASLRAFDRWANVVLSRGSEFETISGHSWKCSRTNIFGWFVNWFLEFFERDHCRRAYEEELKLSRHAREFLALKGD